MAHITLSKKENMTGCKLLVFAEGTILKPKTMFSLLRYNAYCPIGDCVSLLTAWQKQGAEILYITSRKGKQAQTIAALLKQFGFPGSTLFYRQKKETYKDLVEILQPGVLIEDDCRSIGGAWQMCITHTREEIKRTIKSIVVAEFKGIDALPYDLPLLLGKCQTKKSI